MQKSEPAIVAKFIETLLILRNILIVNMSLLPYGTIPKSDRQKEDSTTVDNNYKIESYYRNYTAPFLFYYNSFTRKISDTISIYRFFLKIYRKKFPDYNYFFILVISFCFYL